MATGTKLMKEISDQFLICKICLETFKEPKTLSCLHTFCCACVQQQYDTESNRPTRYTLYTRSVTCPMCRKRTELPTGGVRRLPDNFLVTNLTEVVAKRCVSKVPPCEICHTVRPRSNDACSKCLDCDKLLCRACVDLHSTTKVTQDHGLIDLEGQKDIECKVHPEETVRFYCEKCEACICVVCTFQEHKDHDVCSFSDGFAKHKVTLESLLDRSKERLTSVASRLKVIEKYESLSKQLKERIRDLAISYTSQVRAREKELIKKVDELFSGDVSQLAENKPWLQESFDGLQSACNLTEIVMKDKGVEMLLLKKEIQGKLDHLLEAALPPEPQDLQQLDVQFVPGEVKLGEVFVPGTMDEEAKEMIQKRDCEKIVTNGVHDQNIGSSSSKLNGDIGTDSYTKPCKECLDRKRKREATGDKEREEGGERKVTKSVYIQTKPQEPAVSGGGERCNSYFTTTSSQASLTPSGVSVSHNSMQTHTATVSSRDAGTDSTYKFNSDNNAGRMLHVQRQHGNRARGTMTEMQDVRTLKVQTDESCLRVTHLGQAAATGSTYPNTGAAIAAAFLRHKVTDDDVMSKSWSPQTQREAGSNRLVAKETHDAEVATDISLGLSGNMADAVAALCQGEGRTAGGMSAADCSRPDLLAQTGSAAVSAAPSSPWIRSRKVQTEISALAERSVGDARSGEKLVTDEELNKALFGSSDRTPSRAPEAVSRRDSATDPTSSPLLARARSLRAKRASTRDSGVMTSFKVKVVQDTMDKETSVEPLMSRGVGVMTSVETRAVYIQTRGPRVASTATGTDYEGQMSKSTSTLHVISVDAETAMPQVTQESRTTWTDAVMTSERATCTECSATSDAATLTAQVRSSDAAVQMRPHGVAASTNTTAAKVVHHQCQTSPSVCSRGTMPDPKLLTPSQSLDHSTSSSSSSVHPSPSPPKSTLPAASSSAPIPLNLPSGLALPVVPTSATGPVVPTAVSVVPAAVPVVPKRDKATETAPTRCTTRAVGPNSQMLSSRTTSTDTLNLLQVMDKETGTPTVKTVDDWTHTPQPQMINTGVTPPRPAVLEVGVATVPITLMDQATYTEVKTMRESGTETCLVVCDSETLTEKKVFCDAQTEAEVSTDHRGTAMEAVELVEGGCMTDEMEKPPAPKEIRDNESQCQSPELLSKEVNTTRFRRKAREVQTHYSYMECLLCQHPDKLEQLGVNKTFTDTSTDPSPPDTHDVGTMALSCLASSPGIANTGVQTSTTSLYDKGVATSFEFDEDFTTRPFLGLESQDAATSTESLPYIGLLSEIDVDELIVFPEANFELVSDSDSEYEPVPMVDDETLTEMLDYVEVGTQTLLPLSSSEQSPTLVRPEDDCCKHLVSIGVNTVPKVTFEKETSTPIRHLFSKGTMTFYVAKMDKATSTISHTRSLGGSSAGAAAGRVVKEASRQRTVDHKVTMTNRAEQRDMAVETDSTLVDGRITQCISKLRNVSERLNSPTARKNLEGEVFFGQSFLTGKQKDCVLASTASPKLPSSPKLPCRDINVIRASPPRDKAMEEQQRQQQLHNLLAETDAVLKSKDLSPVRKAQPITTLKPRTPVTPGEVSSGYDSKSLPRQRSLDRQNKVKMGSQATPSSRLPLLRYNSAPGRIATVPAQTLLRKTGQTSPRTSPSKIPVSQKQATATSNTGLSDSAPDSDTYSSSSSQKVQQRPSLPSISETRTPSSCSDSSFISVESLESSLNPSSAMTSSHSRTPSNVTSVSDTASDTTLTKAETTSTDIGSGDGDDSSISSASTTLTVTPQGPDSSSSASPTKQKKEKMGFMQRLLSGKKKKESSSSSNNAEKDSAAKQKTDTAQKLQPHQELQQEAKQPAPLPPPSPSTRQKQSKAQTGQGTKSKQPLKSSASTSSSSSQAAGIAKPHPPPLSSPASSRPSSADSSHSSIKGGASASAAAASPPMAPHHYPPLPDPNKTPPPPRKPRPFVYVRQRIFSIQQDNVEEVKEKKEKEKEKEEKGKARGEDQVKVRDLGKGQDGFKVKIQAKGKDKEKSKAKAAEGLGRDKAVAKSEKSTKGKEIKDIKTVDNGKGTKAVKKAEKAKDSKTEKPKEKYTKDDRKPRGLVCAQ